MIRATSRGIMAVAIAQFIPLVIFPWKASAHSVVFVVVLLALCAFLGWGLITRRSWGRTLTIFVQGFNIIVRVITFFANVYRPNSGVNLALLLTYIVSIVISGFLLSYIDRSEVQLAFES